ncbi:MAG: hypothetical protein GY807_06040 [Gammaproteobacteria bacterium]|nr:hypothetical protein [Gammaproteobacteria bacterium]
MSKYHTNEEFVVTAAMAVAVDYHAPKPSEAYCYRRIKIHIKDTESIRWISRTMVPSTDLNGTIDYGNINEFEFEDGTYTIIGDWGEVKITAGNVEVTLE